MFVITKPTEGNKKYCSAECVKEAKRRRWNAWSRSNYVPVKPHETVCKKCGKVFFGKCNAAYCMKCLSDGSKYMNKILGQRMPGVNVG